MEKSLSSQNEPETPFFCHLCSVSCASALNLQSHFLGIKHRRAEEALRDDKPDKEEPIDIKPEATLQEQLDACKNSEPALGLEYIYQYQKRGYNTYECKLCECRSGLTHMFMHIVGAKHRIYYLSKHHPSLGISGPYIMKGPKKLKKLREICLTVEKEFGRKNINVIEGKENPWSFNTDITGASSVYYTPDSELEKMDFTSDDFFDTDVKPAASEHVVTFLELKASYESDQKSSESSSNSIAHKAEESEELKNDEKDAQEMVKDGESRKDAHEKEEHITELCESDQDFINNKDLLDFLEHFRILQDEDAKFVNTVVEMLSIALMRHKRVSKENEEQKLPVSKYDAVSEQVKLKQQDPASCVVPPNANQALQNSVSSAPQVNRDACFSQTSFSHSHTSSPSRAAPPLFPIAKDDIVNKFFESIKNMEVAEVISTLTTITTTNPAFKGIHVPSLIRYLTEMGKLKSEEACNS
ncbi:uncharacterized protein LOC121001875 isoform X3 [Bufo bufo]|uniref:uncharacterized protein LOC121001875 isoform X3 n=1 Tax=Bufo bufo TaxID=8384 RepID=UPI001ABE6AF9|nr:uncharacterized protein LOC121001875 isoform X3 [Bufo bufo]